MAQNRVLRDILWSKHHLHVETRSFDTLMRLLDKLGVWTKPRWTIYGNPDRSWEWEKYDQ
jgi:hypothetical protein